MRPAHGARARPRARPRRRRRARGGARGYGSLIACGAAGDRVRLLSWGVRPAARAPDFDAWRRRAALGFGDPPVILDAEVGAHPCPAGPGGGSASSGATARRSRPARRRPGRATDVNALRSSSSAPRSRGRGRSARSIACAELARQVAALAAQRRQMSAEAPGRGWLLTGLTPVSASYSTSASEYRSAGAPAVEALGLLGRHVGGRADHVAGARQRVAAEHARDAEVGQLGQPGRRRRALGNQHVRRLDVAVDRRRWRGRA